MLHKDVLLSQLALLETKAPRYTSYPSALYFKPLDVTIYQQWLTNFDSKQSIALYVHIPFCYQLCWFCGCHTRVTHRYAPIQAYVQILVQEMALIAKYAPSRLKLHSIQFGGGSPNILNEDDLETIMGHIEGHFDLRECTEIAIELDPRQLTKEKIDTYKDLGFNRVSLGVQDIDPIVQSAIHRVHSVEQIRQVCDMLRAADLRSINIDLIYGLPFQTLSSIETTMSEICRLVPDRIAYYSFAHIPRIKAQHRLIAEKDLPNALRKGQMYLRAVEIAQAHGYHHLGIDHFMQPQDANITGFAQKKFRRNFMGYTTQANDFVLGIGASAMSNLGNGFAQNDPDSSEYGKTIAEGRFATTRGWVDSPANRLHRTIIHELICYFAVDIEKILAEFGYPLDYFDQHLRLLKQFVEKKVITINARRIDFISPLRMLVRSVCAVFDQYHFTVDETRYLQVS